VDENGSATYSQGFYSWAEQGGGKHQLSPIDLAWLRTWIRELSKTKNTTPIYATNLPSLKAAFSTQKNAMGPRLVMVSFRDGTNWITRQYVAEALPPALFGIEQAIFSTNFSYLRLKPSW